MVATMISRKKKVVIILAVLNISLWAFSSIVLFTPYGLITTLREVDVKMDEDWQEELHSNPDSHYCAVCGKEATHYVSYGGRTLIRWMCDNCEPPVSIPSRNQHFDANSPIGLLATYVLPVVLHFIGFLVSSFILYATLYAAFKEQGEPGLPELGENIGCLFMVLYLGMAANLISYFLQL